MGSAKGMNDQKEDMNLERYFEVQTRLVQVHLVFIFMCARKCCR